MCGDAGLSKGHVVRTTASLTPVLTGSAGIFLNQNIQFKIICFHWERGIILLGIVRYS